MTAAPATRCGPRPLFPCEPVQVIKAPNGKFYVSFNGDNGMGPFDTLEQAQQYASDATAKRVTP